MNTVQRFRELLDKGNFFENHIADFIKRSVLPGRRVMVIGDRRIGRVLRDIEPSYGLGLLLSERDRPAEPIPNVDFRTGAIEDISVETPFDYVVLYESLGYEDRLYQTLQTLKSLVTPETKIFILAINPLSVFFLRLARRFGVAIPNVARNILHLEDLSNLISLCHGDLLDTGYRFLCPFRWGGLGEQLNRLVPRIPFLRRLCFGQYVVFRTLPEETPVPRLSCSVVIPCYNEEGNVAECIERVPDFGSWREIVVVNDGSRDDTGKIVAEIAAQRKDVRLITYEKNQGKGYAVKQGWTAARGDVLMMLDCDMTSPPEELPFFHKVMEDGAEFINGTRIIYPREKKALAFANRLGVAFFATLMSWILQQRISDCFCGTKVFLRKYWNYFEIEEYLWGDWDLFFMARRFRLKMAEFPVHYMARKSGEAKMRPFKHGWKLLLASFRGLKTIP